MTIKIMRVNTSQKKKIMRVKLDDYEKMLEFHFFILLVDFLKNGISYTPLLSLIMMLNPKKLNFHK